MKKGFTLIELLAVIVILAIIALIAVPIVINIIDDSKKNSTLRSADFYLDAVEMSVAQATLKNQNIPDDTYNILPSGNICIKYKTGTTTCEEELVVEVKGEAPKSGQIVIGNGEIEDATVKYSNDKTIVMNNKGEFIYPPTPKSFAEDSWEAIVANVKAGNLSAYKVGDKKEIALTGFTNEEKDENGNNVVTYTIRIANTTTPEECKTEGFSQTACGFVIEFEDIITTHNMNPTGEYKGTQYDSGWNVDGWPASSMRTYVNNEVYNTLPEGLRNAIIPTIVVSGHGRTAGETNFVSEDKIYLLSTAEVWDQGHSNDTARELTRQLEYYKNYKNADGSTGVTTTKYSGAIKNYNGSAQSWWLRSAIFNNTYNFYGVINDGDWSNTDAYGAYGVAVAFRIG